MSKERRSTGSNGSNEPADFSKPMRNESVGQLEGRISAVSDEINFYLEWAKTQGTQYTTEIEIWERRSSGTISIARNAVQQIKRAYLRSLEK